MPENTPDNVLVGMASIPERQASMLRAVASLAPQADRVEVSLNGYVRVPRELARHSNVTATLRGEAGGDAEKFAAVDGWDGYVVTCDDDILYPADYVQTLVAGIERYGRTTAVGFHGGTTLGWNGSAVAASHKRVRCLDELARDDLDINVLGTGAMAYHAERVPVWRGAFRHANMADVQMACHARIMGIPFAALAHKAGWLTDICPRAGRMIYRSNKRRDGSACDTHELREDEIRRFDWLTAPRGRPTVRVSVATCGRPGKLLELLEDLDRESRWVSLSVGVYEDPTGSDYSEARAFCRARAWGWFTHLERLGRVHHWKLVDREIRDAYRHDCDWFMFMPDDIRLVRHAIPKAISAWYRLEDPATLTLWRLNGLEGKANWTGKTPVAGAEASEIFHVDGLYLCRRETLQVFGGRCPRPGRFPATGSGVGRKMSLTLDGLGRRMYRVNESLAIANDDGISIMNPHERERNPAVTL